MQNRRFFQDRLVAEFRRAQRYDDPLALILLDLDHFKEVNDRYGHQVGDQVLRDVADCLQARGARDRPARPLRRRGVRGAAPEDPPRRLAHRGRAHLAATSAGSTPGPSRSLRVTASLGVSGFPNRSVLNAEQLVRTADDALYRAKREGRNKICLFQQAALFGPGSQVKVG